LPPQTDVEREVELSTAERAAYESMLTQLRVEFSDGRKIDAAAQSRLMKLRQITGGLLYGPAGATELGRSKLDELLEVLEEIGDRPAVIWCEFTAEIDRVIAELTRGGRRVGRLDGRVGTDDRTRTIQDFQAGRMQNVVCHPAAAGHGVTLVAAPYAIYYSHSFSFEQYQQSRDRIHRVGQRENTTYFHLLARKTTDGAVWRALRGKRNAHDEVMDALGIGDRHAAMAV
jgi:SNF2 family DNA or RNA helicase